MTDRYLVIYVNEDRDVYATLYSRERLTDLLNNHYWGCEPTFIEPDENGNYDLDTNPGLVIVKGNPMKPGERLEQKMVPQWTVE